MRTKTHNCCFPKGLTDVINVPSTFKSNKRYDFPEPLSLAMIIPLVKVCTDTRN